MRRPESLAGTALQSGRHLWRLTREMVPTWHADSVARLTPSFLDANHVEGVIWDVDGTLTSYHGRSIERSVASHFAELVRRPGIRHLILSNAPESRYAELSNIFPGIPVLRVYELRGKLHRRVMVSGSDSTPADSHRALLEAGARALRKPHAALIREALDVLGCAGSQAVMVGDQYLTDVAGAGLAGIRSIKVMTLAPSTFPKSVRIAQAAEQMLFVLTRGDTTSSIR